MRFAIIPEIYCVYLFAILYRPPRWGYKQVATMDYNQVAPLGLLLH